MTGLGVCEWYALCCNPAEGLVEHPILGYVPTCRRCAGRHDLELLAPADVVDLGDGTVLDVYLPGDRP